MVILKVQSISTICQSQQNCKQYTASLSKLLRWWGVNQVYGLQSQSDVFTDYVRKVLWLYWKVRADIVAMTPTLATAHNSCWNSPRSHSYKHILVVKMITSLINLMGYTIYHRYVSSVNWFLLAHWDFPLRV